MWNRRICQYTYIYIYIRSPRMSSSSKDSEAHRLQWSARECTDSPSLCWSKSQSAQCLLSKHPHESFCSSVVLSCTSVTSCKFRLIQNVGGWCWNMLEWHGITSSRFSSKRRRYFGTKRCLESGAMRRWHPYPCLVEYRTPDSLASTWRKKGKKE